MAGLSEDQLEMRGKIQKTATVWGVIVGVIVGLIAIWLLGGQGALVRFGGGAVVALVAGGLVARASFKSGSKSAQCEKCGAAFSRSRSDHQETLASSEAKEEREEQADQSTKVTTWTEETYDVVDTYTCAKCGHETTKTYQTTRRRDEETKIVPPPDETAGSKKAAAGKQSRPKGEGSAAKSTKGTGAKSSSKNES